MFQDTYQQSRSSSTTSLLNPSCTSEPPSKKLTYNTFQKHTTDETNCKPSPQQSRKLGQVIKELSAPTLGLVLENKGSVARDHLASERTYLAYVRTSLACANAGVAFVQLCKFSGSPGANDPSQGSMRLDRFARPLGVTLVLTGILILTIGLVRFFTTQGALLRGFFPVARNSVAGVTFILGAAVSLVFAVLFAESRG